MKKYLFKNKLILCLTILIIFVSSCFDIGTAFILQIIIDTATSGDVRKLVQSGVFSLVFMLIFAIVKYISLVLTRICNKRILVSIKSDIFTNLLSEDIAEFRGKNIASYISKLTNDIAIIERDYLENFFSLICITFNFFMGLSSILILSPLIVFLSLAVGIITLFIPLVLGRSLDELKRRLSEELSTFTTKIKDIFSGFELIRSYELEEKTIDEFNISNKNLENVKLKTYKKEALVSSASSAANYIYICILLVIVGFQIAKGNLTVGFAVTILQLLDFIVGPINLVGIYINKIKSTSKIIENMKLNNKKTNTNRTEEVTSFKTFIRLRNVSYSYDEKNQVLTNINFTFKKNKKYAIVGSSGGGKSTLLQLIAGNLINYKGSIVFDNKEINNITFKSLYSIMSILYQDTFLFDDTIFNNITLYDDKISETTLNKAIDLAGLKQTINSKKNKIFTNVGENGMYLSGGERKRVAIARALIKNNEILLLDEAFSSLDPETATKIESSLLAIEDLTIISVTHNFSKNNLEKYDYILVLNDGTIKELGNFCELMDKKGYFKGLFNSLYGG